MPPQKKLKILFVSSEVVPFVKTGGLADVSSALPQKLQELGHQVRIVVPKYGAIDERKYKIHEVVRLKDLTTKMGDREVTFSLRSSFLVGRKARVQIYFLDNEEYFGSRHSLYADPLTGEDFEDNDERFILLARSVFELVRKLGWIPDIIHCNDWQCALVPVFLKEEYSKEEIFSNIKSVFTIHNLSNQGIFPVEKFSATSLPESLKTEDGILHNGSINFLKAGLNFADIITTVSERYADEICAKEEFSAGMQEVLCSRKDSVFGIINGIDDNIWNPEKDKNIAKKYTLKTIENKIQNKKALADKFGFEYKPDTPVIGMISRLNAYKGYDLIVEKFEELMSLDIHLVLLGAGEKEYHRFFEQAFGQYADKFSCYLGFDDQLAHLIEAGSDMFLMPSKFEPCGLNQMYSLVYGTVPIVRETGGLADTVENYNPVDGSGNGFVFSEYTGEALMDTVRKAIDMYNDDQKTWLKIVKNGMKDNFSWLNSSKKYVELYKTIID